MLLRDLMRNSSLSRAWQPFLKAHLCFALTCYFMTQPSFAHVECPDPQGHHRMAYVRWGDPLASHVVVCVHGLTRQGRDFDRCILGLDLRRLLCITASCLLLCCTTCG